MSNRVVVKNSTVAGKRPAAVATNKPGELWVNTTDRVIGTFDTSGNPVNLAAPQAMHGVFYFLPTDTYAKGSIVSHNGKLYRANTSITTGAFNASQWDEISVPAFTAGSIPFADTGGALTEDAANLKYDLANRSLTVNGLTVGSGGGAVNTNSVIGNGALAANISGGNNVAVGRQALNANKTGAANTAVGAQSLSSVTTGSNNQAYGYNSGSGVTTGSNNVIIGSAPGEAAMNNTVIIADGAGNERGRFDARGRFGIGTATPTSGITLRDGETVKADFQTTLSTGGNCLQFSRGANGAILMGFFGYGNKTSDEFMIRNQLNSSITFWVGGVTKFTIRADGLIDFVGKTTSQIKATVGAVKGTIAFCNDTNSLCFYDGAMWQKCTSTPL